VDVQHRHEIGSFWVGDDNLGRLGSFVKLSYPGAVTVDRSLFSADNCSIKGTLDVVGEKWTLLVLREAFYGARRFEQFHERVGCARNLLSERLSTLVEHEILRREPYREPGQRARHEYRLTDKGLELFTVLVALMQWGDRWTAPPGGPAVVLEHRGCHEPLEAIVRCGAGHETLGARDSLPMPGPGARRAA
jgi:DNA-binding HxlR family transcriptional regulator